MTPREVASGAQSGVAIAKKRARVFAPGGHPSIAGAAPPLDAQAVDELLDLLADAVLEDLERLPLESSDPRGGPPVTLDEAKEVKHLSAKLVREDR